MTEIQSISIDRLQDLNKWLDQNWHQKNSVWLVFYKKSSNKADFTYSDIVDVLLCYGWIDSLPNKVDSERTKLRISPRNPKSHWSRVNKEKISKLMEQNQMHPNGLRIVEIAQANGAWSALDEVENLTLPPDLESFLQQNQYLETWHALSRSFKRGFLEQLLNCKKAETRARKIESLRSKLE